MSIINYSNYSQISLRIVESRNLKNSFQYATSCTELFAVTVRFGRFNSDTGYTCEVEE